MKTNLPLALIGAMREARVHAVFHPAASPEQAVADVLTRAADGDTTPGAEYSASFGVLRREAARHDAPTLRRAAKAAVAEGHDLGVAQLSQWLV